MLGTIPSDLRSVFDSLQFRRRTAYTSSSSMHTGSCQALLLSARAYIGERFAYNPLSQHLVTASKAMQV